MNVWQRAAGDGQRAASGRRHRAVAAETAWGWQQKAADCRQAGSGQRAAGSGQRAAGSGQRAAGSGQRAAGEASFVGSDGNGGYVGLMGSAIDTQVAAVNELTARWAALSGDRDFVVSGAGVWPLLALLAAAADGPARAELEAAVGLPAERAQGAALEVLRIMAEAEELSAALGAWFAEGFPLHRAWTDSLPPDIIGRLTGQEALDSWAARGTGGLIDRFPLRIEPDTMLVLATALVAKTEWCEHFADAVLRPETGPWRGIVGRGLTRTTGDLSQVSLLDGPDLVTRVVVTGTGDLDVHLLLGAESNGGESPDTGLPGIVHGTKPNDSGSPDTMLGAAPGSTEPPRTSSPGAVLTTGLAALTGDVPVRNHLPPGTTGPGLRVTQHRAPRPGDRLDIRLPPFEIRSSHDLCATPELFGLTAAMRTDRNHFPAISPEPLALAHGVQDVLARFTREGFEAAAVTSFAAVAVSMPLSAEHLITQVEVAFDRPFGFLAVHRATGLAVVAGWVAELPARIHAPGDLHD
ncbi:serpin family protein [Nocardia amikacinitolerans]|uniref:serpin family protein n=1 Tax=Nocardia amikacinitolerans TaxID=756689 RepID=UPI00369BA465